MSIIFTVDSFGIKISPPLILLNELITNSTLSFNVIKNLVISGCVRGNILFLDSFIFLNKGITEPLEFITLPYLTTENNVLSEPERVLLDTNNLSEANFVAP